MPAVEKVELARFDPSKVQKHEQIKGISPFANKLTEGPSYIKPENRQAPLKVSGALDNQYGKFRTDSTPLLGTEYSEDVRLKDVLNNPDQIRDLAIIITQRGVAFFRNQDDLTVEEQKQLIHQLGLESGKPKTSKLHKHPTSPAGGVVHGDSEFIDPEVSFISSRLYKEYDESVQRRVQLNGRAGDGWHSDITFEPVPADFTSLKIIELPENGVGGDTVWANGYALLEKFSPSFRQFLESLTGTYTQRQFDGFGNKKEFELYTQARGAPENVGNVFSAVHPIVRTNPVTGWKTLSALGVNFGSFNEVSPIESELLKKFIQDTLVNSHDIQVRFKWNKNDIAVWDNRSTYHSATYDLGQSEREGLRTVGIAERPYLDPNSKYQSEDLHF